MLVRILGPLELEGGRPVGSGQAARLLGTLALHANAPVAAAELAEVVLGHERAATAPHDLYVVVSRLRSQLRTATAAASIEHDHRGYRLDIDAHDVDAHRFDALVRGARSGLTGPQRISGYLEALGLWRGRVLDGLDLPLDPVAVRIEELRLVSQEELLRLRLAGGDAAEVVPELLALCAQWPTREGLAALAMEALGDLGRRDEALAHYHRFQRSLATELGLEPSAELRALERRLIEGGLPTADAAVGTTSDLNRARHANQVSRRKQAEPWRTGAPLGLFVGRHQLLVDVTHFLRSDRRNDRLLTVTGPGGVGKTRLALEAAGAERQRSPIIFVDLTALGPEGTTADTVAAAVGLAVGQPRVSIDELVRSLPDEEITLLLDNCEHVVAAAAIAVRELLRAMPALRILATSRRPLAVNGERLLRLAPLALGDAVQLLAERAERITGRPLAQEEPLHTVCQALDGLPLAIELAASRLQTMTLPELVDRLGDQLSLLRNPLHDGRHASLASVIEWSVSLLPQRARQLFGRLGAFTGGFDLDAAVAVGGLPSEWETIDALDQLVAASLLTTAPQSDDKMRYRMLDAVLSAAVDALDCDPEHAAVRRRHADHFAGIAGRPYDAGTDAALATELPNLRSAVQLAIAAGDTHLALHVTGRLGSFAMRQTGALEAEGWAQQALSLTGARDDPSARWTAHAVAIIRNLHGDAVGCEAHCRQALQIEHRLRLEADPRLLNTLVLGVIWQGRFTEARRVASQALALAMRMDRPFEQIDALFNLVHCDLFEGRTPNHAIVDRLVEVAELTGRDVARSIAAYGGAAAHLGIDDAVALSRFRACIHHAERADARHLLIGPSLALIGLIDAGDDPERAFAALRTGLEHYAERHVAFGARRLTREFFPTLIDLGHHDAVATLDGAAAPLSYQPGRTRKAVLDAVRLLGVDRFEALRSSGAHFDDAQIMAYTDQLTRRLP